MGAAQVIPGVGETITAIDSGVKMIAAGSCAVVGEVLDDKNAKDVAKKLANDARNSWVEYTERNLIAATVRAFVHSARGNEMEADRVLRKMGNSVVEIIDNTPVIGHAKGIVHYAIGDTERGHDCMKGATRVLVVAGAGALTGGVGAGVVAGGLAGVSSGIAYDGTVSFIQVANKGKAYGIMASIESAAEAAVNNDDYGFISSAINIGYTLVGDFAAGASAAKAAKKLNKASKQRKVLKKAMGKKRARDTVKTAKRFKKLQKKENIKGDAHVITRTKNLRTKKVTYGTNERCRQQMRLNKYKLKDKASGYTGKGNARKGKNGQFPRTKGILVKKANELNMDIKETVKLKNGKYRSFNACAEQEAFHKLGVTGHEAKVTTVSVEYRNGGFTTVERCGNCKQFGKLMGKVATDGPKLPVPTQQFAFDASLCAVTSAGAYAVAAEAFSVRPIREDNEDD